MASRRSRGKHGIREVARACGVSPSTVSRVFNKKPYVRESLRQQILDAARRLNYRPKATARKDNIAIIVEGMTEVSLGGYRSMMISALTAEVFKRGYRSEVIPLSDVELLHENFVLAAIALVSAAPLPELESAARSIPVFAVNNRFRGCHAVCSDHAGGARMAAEHLIEKGHRRIGLVMCDSGSWGSVERMKGYRHALDRHGLAFEPVLTQFTEEMSVVEAIARMMKGKPTAVVVAGEDLALPSTYAFDILGKSVPADISIVSFEHPTISCYLSPPHTTVSQNPKSMATVLLDQIQEAVAEGEGSTRRKPRRTVLANDFIVRESVRELV